VQRLRLFVKSSLEALWLSLLDACAQLQGLSEELLQVGAELAICGGVLGAWDKGNRCWGRCRDG